MFTTGNTASVNWIAGQTYYILVDAEVVGVYDLTFTINCPGTVVTAGDCAAAVNVCTNLTFAVDPSGFGAINEICPAGTCAANPNVNPASLNSGCLLSGELNSTWMVVNIATNGTLEFSFGSPGGAVCYDWIMWPYSASTCNDIFAGTQAPVRCNWNSSCTAFTGMAAIVPAGGFPGDFEPPLAVLAGQQYIICFSNFSSATTSVPLNFFGTASVSCTPLATEFTSFNGYKMNDEVMLNWKSETESVVAYFDLMHSSNGVDFTNIAKVSAKQLSSADELYEFIHIEPSQGVNYYKLLKTDIFNKTEESSVVVINFHNDEMTIGNVYPNPANDISYLDIQSSVEMVVSLLISDLTGKVVQTGELKVLKGKNKFGINSGLFEKGVYQITIRTGNNSINNSQMLIIN